MGPAIFSNIFFFNYQLIVDVTITAALVAQLCPTLAIPWTVAHQAPLHGILQARILEWGALPTPGDVPSPEIELASLSFKKNLFILIGR